MTRYNGDSMVENVQGRTLYHATVTNSYKAVFVKDQIVTVATEHNPFFRFYESTLEFPITDGQTGSLLKVNAVEWIQRVRAGTIQTTYPILADKAFQVSQHYMMLARELIMEQIRVEEFEGKAPSRQTCLFLADSVEEARSWLPLVGHNGLICELTCSGIIHYADSRLMLAVSEPLSITRDKARGYWRGDVSADPKMEILFRGEATVSAIAL